MVPARHAGPIGQPLVRGHAGQQHQHHGAQHPHVHAFCNPGTTLQPTWTDTPIKVIDPKSLPPRDRLGICRSCRKDGRFHSTIIRSPAKNSKTDFSTNRNFVLSPPGLVVYPESGLRPPPWDNGRRKRYCSKEIGLRCGRWSRKAGPLGVRRLVAAFLSHGRCGLPKKRRQVAALQGHCLLSSASFRIRRFWRRGVANRAEGRHQVLVLPRADTPQVQHYPVLVDPPDHRWRPCPQQGR